MLKSNEIVALAEFSDSHDECLLTQLNALKSAGHTTILICRELVRNRNPSFEELVDEFYLSDFSEKRKSRRELLKFLKLKKVSKLVLNTAQGGMVRDLCIHSVFNNIEFIGIVHSTKKFDGSFTQKLINWKIKKYFLLSDALVKKCKKKKGLKLDYFFPIRLPSADSNSIKHEGLNITVIGSVEKRKKDLLGFIPLLEQSDTSIQFTFLGHCHPKSEDFINLEHSIKATGKENQVNFYREFISQEEFSKVLSETDLILPLIHPRSECAVEYFESKISGAVNVSFAHKIPMLIHEHYAPIQEMKSASFYYEQENFGDLMNSIKENLESKKEEMKNDSAYNPATQEKRYLNFIFDQEK